MVSPAVAEMGYPISDIDPFSRDYLREPYPFHAQLRDAGPVVWLAKWDSWAVARFAEVAAVLRDPKTFCSSAGVGAVNFNIERPWRPPSLLLEADPPDHTRRRTVMGRVLSVPNLRRLKDGFERAANALIDRTAARENVDGVADIAQAYVLEVFPDAVGLAPDGRENLLAYGNMVFNSFGPRNDVFLESTEEADAVRDWIMQRCERDALSPSGLGREVYAGVDAGEISADEAILLVRSLLSAGVDTTVDAIGSILLCFGKHPSEWEKLRKNPSRARSAIEEVLRYESPFQTFFRTTACDVSLAGQRIAKNQKIMVSIGSANRDPAKWENPTSFDIDRKVAGHMAFGAGIHGCVGQMISRLEAEVFLTALAKRIDNIAITGDPVWKVNNTLRGLASLPLTLHPA
jgi:cytochrome P450